MNWNLLIDIVGVAAKLSIGIDVNNSANKSIKEIMDFLFLPDLLFLLDRLFLFELYFVIMPIPFFFHKFNF
ncbi:hypothetical protein SDC9_193867 [bioreactor metagenome]|uniref:Uncharacterized protein n=1 Tax=bioreactor metagenome TaxID=1076179 RepID=A0A645I656_9ZZZZ